MTCLSLSFTAPSASTPKKLLLHKPSRTYNNRNSLKICQCLEVNGIPASLLIDSDSSNIERLVVFIYYNKKTNTYSINVPDVTKQNKLFDLPIEKHDYLTHKSYMSIKNLFKKAHRAISVVEIDSVIKYQKEITPNTNEDTLLDESKAEDSKEDNSIKQLDFDMNSITVMDNNEPLDTIHSDQNTSLSTENRNENSNLTTVSSEEDKYEQNDSLEKDNIEELNSDQHYLNEENFTNIDDIETGVKSSFNSESIENESGIIELDKDKHQSNKGSSIENENIADLDSDNHQSYESDPTESSKANNENEYPYAGDSAVNDPITNNKHQSYEDVPTEKSNEKNTDEQHTNEDDYLESGGVNNVDSNKDKGVKSDEVENENDINTSNQYTNDVDPEVSSGNTNMDADKGNTDESEEVDIIENSHDSDNAVNTNNQHTYEDKSVESGGDSNIDENKGNTAQSEEVGIKENSHENNNNINTNNQHTYEDNYVESGHDNNIDEIKDNAARSEEVNIKENSYENGNDINSNNQHTYEDNYVESGGDNNIDVINDNAARGEEVENGNGINSNNQHTYEDNYVESGGDNNVDVNKDNVVRSEELNIKENSFENGNHGNDFVESSGNDDIDTNEGDFANSEEVNIKEHHSGNDNYIDLDNYQYSENDVEDNDSAFNDFDTDYQYSYESNSPERDSAFNFDTGNNQNKKNLNPASKYVPYHVNRPFGLESANYNDEFDRGSEFSVESYSDDSEYKSKIMYNKKKVVNEREVNSFDTLLHQQVDKINNHRNFKSGTVDFNTIRNQVQDILHENGFYLTSRGVLLTEFGQVVDKSNLRFRTVLIGNTVGYTFKDPKIKQSTAYLEAILLTLKNPPRILGVIPIRLTHLPTEKNKNRDSKHWNFNSKIQKPIRKNHFKRKQLTRTSQALKNNLRSHSNNRIPYRSFLFSKSITNHLKDSPVNAFLPSRRSGSTNIDMKDDKMSINNEALNCLLGKTDAAECKNMTYYDSHGFRIIGGNAATLSGAPLSTKA